MGNILYLCLGGMSSNGPMLYQTPNGLIYAATGAVPSINGVPQIFNLPSVPPSNSIAVQNEQSGTNSFLINILIVIDL